MEVVTISHGDRLETQQSEKKPSVNPGQPLGRPLSSYVALGSILLDSNPDYRTNESGDHDDTFHIVQIRHPKYAANDPETLEPLAGLIQAGWIRALVGSFDKTTRSEVLRVYLLPDDVARATIDGRDRKHTKMLQTLIALMDVSSTTWNGHRDSQDFNQPNFDLWATAEHSSLFYLFNTLPSPNPKPETIPNPQLRHAVYRILEDDASPCGLKTTLYSYQRKCVATMIRKENVQGRILDPRLETRQSPTGSTYYYGPRDTLFLQNPRYYETCPGGILAETMGLGKTLICIVVILLTRGQYPTVPLQFDSRVVHHEVRSLAHTCAGGLLKYGLPWKAFFADFEDCTGYDMNSCKTVMKEQALYYELPPPLIRSMRYAQKYGHSEQIRLCSGTLIVVPLNLLQQWRKELQKHVKEGALSIKVLKDSKEMIPPANELCKYDIVLFSMYRFKIENKQFTDVEYTSPLKQIHWLRIIIDEGHGFSSGASHAAAVAEKLIKAERRWIVTGTPARDLLGIEVDVPAMTMHESETAFQKYKELSLENRRVFEESQERASGAVRSIGALATKFLRAQPWSLAASDEENASWDEHIYRHADFRHRTFTSFSKCLRTTLEDLIVKTRPEDVDKDVRLPPLRHEVVRLNPSPHDKMTANLFVLLYTTNAVTSERRDQDYLFHSKSRAHLQRLTMNLRQSAFYWVGFNEKDVAKSLETGKKYLEKVDTSCSGADRVSLNDIMNVVTQILSLPTWKALAQSTEMGCFVEDWPAETGIQWSLGERRDSPMLGLSQLIDAQKYVNNQLTEDNPLNGFEDAGRASNIRLLEESQALEEGSLVTRKEYVDLQSKSGIPSAGYGDGNMGAKRISATGTSRISPKKLKAKSSSNSIEKDDSSPRKRRWRLSKGSTSIELDPDTGLGRTRLVGTASSKLSYLIDRIAGLHSEEKILVFYDAGYIAYYLSQALDLLDIKHLIYANTLGSQQRSEYTVLFETDPSTRVLVMDLKQAAHGLNLSAASRVFFVNPPWRPEIEAQAIKRAHRIGQTRPVHVETLVLKGTVEEAMFERAAKMTKREHVAAKTLEDDDDMRAIIQNQSAIPISEEELKGENAMARLKTPQKVFGRPGRAEKMKAGMMEQAMFGAEDAHRGGADEEDATPRKRTKKNNSERRVRFDDEETVAGIDATMTGGGVAVYMNGGDGPAQSAVEHSIFGGS